VVSRAASDYQPAVLALPVKALTRRVAGMLAIGVCVALLVTGRPSAASPFPALTSQEQIHPAAVSASLAPTTAVRGEALTLINTPRASREAAAAPAAYSVQAFAEQTTPRAPGGLTASDEIAPPKPHASDASPAVREIIERLTRAKTPIMGMHDTLGGEQESGFARLKQLCGQQPGLWSSDFGFSRHPNDSVGLRDPLLEKATRLHQQGTLITLSWHQCNPVVDEPCTFKEGVQQPLTEAQWAELLTPGSSLNRRWKHQLDRITPLLSALQKRGVPVLFRPLHESNIPGFWWSSPDASRSIALWKQLRQHFSRSRALHNIVWVWSVSYHPKFWTRMPEYYPGDDEVDVVGLDIYPPTREGPPDFETGWTALKRVAPTKPIALSEISRLPTPAELRARPWAYVVPWGRNMLLRDNTVDIICSAYTS